MNILETETIRLRALEPEDIDALYKWENDPNLWKLSNTIAPFSRYILRRFIENQRYDIYETKQMRLIVESKADGKVVGAVDLFDLDPTNRRAGMGILIYDDADQQKGYGSDAINVITLYAFNVLGLNQLYCNILTNNAKSLGIFKKKGFKVIGIKMEWVKTTTGWLDEYMLQLINPIKH